MICIFIRMTERQRDRNNDFGKVTPETYDLVIPLKMDNSHSDPQFKSDRDRWHRVSVKKNVDEKSLNNPILIEKFSSVKTIWKHTIAVKFSVFGGNLSRKSFLVGIGRSLKIAIIRNNLLFCLIPLSSPQFIKRKKYIQKLLYWSLSKMNYFQFTKTIVSYPNLRI